MEVLTNMFNFGKSDKIVGFTNGCFDILHVGHIKLFQYLKNKSDEVIIGIDSDKRVKELKGPHRPINNERDRKLMLESLSFVDSVLIFDSANELELLVKTLSPDLMVVGSDYRDRHVVGGEYAKKLEFFEKIDGYSTTRTLQRSTDR
jgi:rfaE bifunctional protein nucleotidyltransferase chain/domain